MSVDVQDSGALRAGFWFFALAGGVEPEPAAFACGGAAFVAGREPVGMLWTAIVSGVAGPAVTPRYCSSNPAALCSALMTIFTCRTLSKNSRALVLSPRPM